MGSSFTFISEKRSRVFSGPEQNFSVNFLVWVRALMDNGNWDHTPMKDVGFSLGTIWSIGVITPL